MRKFGLAEEELKIFRRLTTPAKVQDFLNSLPVNFERKGETLMSPRRVLRERKAHCMEGALLAAAAFWVNGAKPLLLDLKTARADNEHVVALFRRYGSWGAVGKTNHAVLRYREPVYRTVREIALSYFHEYFLDDGRKTLRSWSDPFDLSKFEDKSWITAEDDLWYLSEALDRLPHHRIVSPAQIRTLRLADKVEREAGKLVEWERNRG